MVVVVVMVAVALREAGAAGAKREQEMECREHRTDFFCSRGRPGDIHICFPFCITPCCSPTDMRRDTHDQQVDASYLCGRDQSHCDVSHWTRQAWSPAGRTSPFSVTFASRPSPPPFATKLNVADEQARSGYERNVTTTRG